HLPRDTPGEEKLRLTPTSAPQRLIFIPSAGQWQMIGLVSYRQRDTEGRPGSYFAHLLCRESKEGCEAWTLTDALRLWQAPGWVTADSPEHPFRLEALPGLDLLLAGEEPRIDDRALLSFLKGDDRATGSRLPERWRDLLPKRRVEVLQAMVDSLLVVGTTRRQSLVVAVEPEVAALLFYGVGRLIPPAKLRQEVSVSTYEASTDRLTTVLAATTFWNPVAGEFRADALRGRGVAINTFAELPTEQRPRAGYAERIVRRLLDEGPAAVDRRLAAIAASVPDGVEQLPEFARTEQAVEALFRSATGSGDAFWRTNPALSDFARRLTLERLESLEGSESALNSVCGGASQATILELAGTVPPGTGADRAVRFLLQRLPEQAIAPFVADPRIVDAWKTQLLRSRIGAAGRTPAGMEWIWSDAADGASLAPDRRGAIALGVVGELPAPALVALLESLAPTLRPGAVDRLLDSCEGRPERFGVLAEVLRRFDADSLIAWWLELGHRLFEVPAPADEVVSARVEEVLDTLHRHAADFVRRLAFLEAGRLCLGSPEAAVRLSAWVACRDAIGALLADADAVGAWSRVAASRRREAVTRSLAESALLAMPAALVEDDRQGSVKQECLRQIARHLEGGGELLPVGQWQNEALWKKIRWRMEMGSWPSIPLRKLVGRPGEQKQVWIALAIAAAVVLAAVAVIGLATIGTGAGGSRQLTVEHGVPPSAAGSSTVGKSAAAQGESAPVAGTSEAALPEQPAPEPDRSETVFRRPVHAASDRDITQELHPAASGQEKPLTMVRGDFSAGVSSVSALQPPAVAVVGLHVRTPDDPDLSRRLLARYVLGAVVQEHSAARNVVYHDFPDLQKRNEIELSDGVEKVLVQFRFSGRPTAPAGESAGIQAASSAWAEVPVGPAHRYDVEFVLSVEAVRALGQLAGETESAGPGVVESPQKQ
ncbi:MAG: hypothetical protein ACYC6Y_22140, partial [Thermoguttaceae bacterium]